MPGGTNQCHPHPALYPAGERMLHYSACARQDCSRWRGNNSTEPGRSILSMQPLSSCLSSCCRSASLSVSLDELKPSWSQMKVFRCIGLDKSWFARLSDWKRIVPSYQRPLSWVSTLFLRVFLWLAPVSPTIKKHTGSKVVVAQTDPPSGWKFRQIIKLCHDKIKYTFKT